MTTTAVVSAVILGGIIFVGGELILGVGTLGGEAAATTTIIEIGGSSATVSVEGGLATVEVGFVESMDAGFIQAVIDAAAEGGAESILLDTGPVINTDLAIDLGLAANSGRTIVGGVVTLTGASADGCPIFDIFWEVIPNITW